MTTFTLKNATLTLVRSSGRIERVLVNKKGSHRHDSGEVDPAKRIDQTQSQKR